MTFSFKTMSFSRYNVWYFIQVFKTRATIIIQHYVAGRNEIVLCDWLQNTQSIIERNELFQKARDIFNMPFSKPGWSDWKIYPVCFDSCILLNNTIFRLILNIIFTQSFEKSGMGLEFETSDGVESEISDIEKVLT